MSSSSRSKPFLKRSLLSYAIAVAAAGTLAQSASAAGIDLCSGFPAVSINSLHVDQNCTLTVNEGTLTVTGAGVLDRGVEVDTNTVTINNMGDIKANQGLNTELYSLYFDGDANGTLTNSGNITAAISGSISGSGLTGSCSGSGSGSCYSLNTGGSVNALFIDGALGGSVTNTEDHTISASAYGSANTSFPSDMSLSAAAVIIADGIAADGSFDNQGTVTATSEAYAYSYYYGNGDENASANAAGVYVSDISGAFINGGDITATATAASGTTYGDVYASAYAIGVSTDAINSYGSFTNSGHITATSTTDATSHGSYAEAYASAVGVNIGYSSDFAAIDHNNAGGIAGSFSNDGSIEATATATSSAYNYAYAYADAQATGVNVGDISSTGTFTNEVTGTIVANATATAAADTYAEFYANASASATGLEVNNLDGSLVNKGSIAANATALSTAYNNAYAFAFADAMGVYLGDVNGTFTNEGSISATATATATGYHNDIREQTANVDASGVDAEAIGIDAVWANAYGASIAATATATATGYNDADVSAEASAIGVHVHNIYGSLSNLGMISAEATATAAATSSSYGSASASASATGLSAEYIDTYGSLTNSGTISAVATATGTDVSVYDGRNEVDADALGMELDGIAGVAINTATGYITAEATTDVAAYHYAYGYANASALGASTNDIYSYGSFTNAGHITATADTTAKAYNYAYAYAYARATGLETSSISVDGVLSNTGSIVATATNTATAYDYAYAYAYAGAIGVSTGDISGSFVNEASGVISASATASVTANDYAGVDVYDVYGSITRSRPDSRVAVYVQGVQVESVYGSSLDNMGFTNKGTISATATAHVTANDHAIADGYANAIGVRADSVYGSMINALGGHITAIAIATADANSYGDASANGQAYGVLVGDVALGGSLTNKGQITATSTLTATAAHATAQASGLIYATGAEANVVYGSFTNDYSIIASATGTTSGSDAHAYTNASGMHASYLYGTMTNSKDATIVVSALSDRDSAVAFGMHAYNLMSSAPMVDVAPGAQIVNAGTIIVNANSVDSYGSPMSSADAYGIYVGDLGYGTMIDNSGTISVHGNEYGSVYGIYVDGGSGTVNNSGTMNAGVYLGSSCSAVASSACGAPGSVSLTNSGSITTRINSDSYVSGDYTQTGTGSLSFEVDHGQQPVAPGFGKGTGGYARMDIGGNADFSANNKVMMAVNIQNTLQDGDVLADVITAGTFTTTALKLTDNSAFFDFTYVVDGNTIDVTANKVTATGAVAGSGLNLSASGAALVDGLIADAGDGDNGGTADSGVYNDLANALFHATTAQEVAAVLESVGPVMFNAQATRAVGDSANKALGNHLSDTRSASSGDAFKDGAVWIKPFFGKAEQDAANGVSGYDVDTSGFLIGVDGAVSDAMRVGVAYAGANSNVDGGNGSKSDINTMQFVAYGSYAMGSNMMLDLNVGWATNEYDQRRAAFGNGIALANYNGTQLTAGAELSYSYKINDKLTFIPSLAARFSQVKTDGYTETGAVINNTVLDADENAVLATAKGAFEWSVGSAGTLLANVGVSSNSSDAASVTTSLSGSGATYVSNGIEQDSTLINAGVGYRYVTSKSLAVTAAYDMESSSGFQASTVSVKVKMPF